LPPISGGVFPYLAFAEELGPDQPVLAIQARGLGPGEEAFAELGPMVAWYREQVRSARPRGPYRLGGWSMGGFLALEVARALVAAGEEVEALVLFDPWMNGMVDAARGPSGVTPDEAWFLAEVLGFNVGGDLLPEREPGKEADRLRFVLGRAERQAAIPREHRAWAEGARETPGLDMAEVHRLAELQRRHRRAFAGYAMARYEGRVTYVLATLQNDGTRRADLEPVRLLMTEVAATDFVEVAWNHRLFEDAGIRRVLAREVLGRLDPPAFLATVARGADAPALVAPGEPPR
jgi:hypothetical protein